MITSIGEDVQKLESLNNVVNVKTSEPAIKKDTKEIPDILGVRAIVQMVQNLPYLALNPVTPIDGPQNTIENHPHLYYRARSEL